MGKCSDAEPLRKMRAMVTVAYTAQTLGLVPESRDQTISPGGAVMHPLPQEMFMMITGNEPHTEEGHRGNWCKPCPPGACRMERETDSREHRHREGTEG